MIKFRRCIPLGFSQLANLQIRQKIWHNVRFFWFLSDFLGSVRFFEKSSYREGIESARNGNIAESREMWFSNTSYRKSVTARSFPVVLTRFSRKNLTSWKKSDTLSDFLAKCQIFWENQAVGEAKHPRGTKIFQKVGKCDSLIFRIENL